jgi:hypothetical protein
MSSGERPDGNDPDRWTTNDGIAPFVHRCLVCGRDLATESNRSGYCDEHDRQRRARQSGRLDADELSSQWGDTLALWRDPPPAVAQVTQPGRYRFRRRRDGWLLFMYSENSRLPDWLAVDLNSGTLLRFSDVSENLVWRHISEFGADDEAAARPGSSMATQPRWSPGTIGTPTNLAAMANAAFFPIATVNVDQLPLRLASLTWSTSGGRLESVQLEFREVGSTEHQVSTTLLSAAVSALGETAQLAMNAPDQPDRPNDLSLFQTTRLLHGAEFSSDEKEWTAVELRLEGRNLRGHALVKSHGSDQTGLFQVRDRSALVIGKSVGFGPEELNRALRHITSLRESPSLYGKLETQLKASFDV